MVSDESQVAEAKVNGKRKRRDRGRVFTFIVYVDSSYEDWIARLDALHVRAFISPLHDADVAVDGTLKKAHWHVIFMFEGKKSRDQIDAIREEAIGPDFNREVQDVNCLGAMARYLIHADNPEKAQYRREDVISLGGADYDLAIVIPGDDVVTLGEIGMFIMERGVTNTLGLIAILRAEGRADWMSYVSRHLQGVNGLCTQNMHRLRRIQRGWGLSGDFAGVVGDVKTN